MSQTFMMRWEKNSHLAMKAMMFCVFDTKQQSPKFAEIMKKVNCWINSNHWYLLFHGLEYCMENANSTQKILFIYQNTTQSIKFEDRHVLQESTLNNSSTTNFQDHYITLHASTACMLYLEKNLPRKENNLLLVYKEVSEREIVFQIKKNRSWTGTFCYDTHWKR